MKVQNLAHQLQKVGGWMVFWGLLLGVLFLLSSTLNSNAAAPSKTLADQTAQPDWVTATPTADEILGSSQPDPPSVAGDSSLFAIFLPLISKFPLVIPPDTIVPIIFGPIVDPPDPAGISVAATPPSADTPVVDPRTPTPPTPTPGGPPTATSVPPGVDTPTSTPKATFTATVRPTATEEFVPNGQLENDGNGWIEFSLQDLEIFYDEDCDDCYKPPGGAYEGDWAAWLGGFDSEISYMQRTFNVPDPPDDYQRYYIAHRIRLQSYDSVCASEKYGSMTSTARDELLAGHLLHARASTLDVFGVDLGGMIVCVNQPDESGCGAGDVKTIGSQKQIYVSAYDLCDNPDASGWNYFYFPISVFSGAPDELAGERITVQIKTITDSQLSSSVLVDNVVWLGGPPLPPLDSSSTSLTAAGGEPIHLMTPILAPHLEDELLEISQSWYTITGDQPKPAAPSDTFYKPK